MKKNVYTLLVYDIAVAILYLKKKRVTRHERDSNPRSSVYETDALAAWPPCHTVNSVLVFAIEHALATNVPRQDAFLHGFVVNCDGIRFGIPLREESFHK